MTGRQRRERVAAQALRRAFAVALLLAGLVAMHALTVGHEPVPSSAVAGAQDVMAGGHAELEGPAQVQRGTHSHGASAAVTAGTGSMPGATNPNGGMTLDEPTVSTPAMILEDGCEGCGDGSGGSHAGSHLFDICLAVLLGGAVTLVLVAAARPVGLGVSRVAEPRANVIASRQSGPRPPSRFQLCVLRT